MTSNGGISIKSLASCLVSDCSSVSVISITFSSGIGPTRELLLFDNVGFDFEEEEEEDEEEEYEEEDEEEVLSVSGTFFPSSPLSISCMRLSSTYRLSSPYTRQSFSPVCGVMKVVDVI